MAIEEGSVDIDGAGFDDEEEFEDSTSEIETDINNSSTSDGEDNNSSASTASDDDQDDDSATANNQNTEDQTDGKTEKGTKLADDPLQAANQLRANAEARTREYENFLQDPEALERYVADLKASRGTQSAEKPADVNEDTQALLDIEDLRTFEKLMKQSVTDEIGQVKQTVSGMVETQKQKATADKVGGGITAVQTKYPELREKNSDGTKNPLFNPVFDKKLGDLYEKLDFDKKTQTFRGQVDIVELADTLAEMMNTGKVKGSAEAQTIVKDKRAGKTSQQGAGSSSDVDESKMTSSQMIAARIKRSRTSNRR
jgi:hypothetical protein